VNWVGFEIKYRIDYHECTSGFSIGGKMDYETAKKLTSPCGLPCFHCPAYLATTNAEIRKRVSETLNISEENAACEGCRPQEGKIKLLKPDEQCKLFKCAAERKVEFCNECDNFPCERFQLRYH